MYVTQANLAALLSMGKQQLSTPDQAQGGEQQGSKPPFVEQPGIKSPGPTEHGEATVAPGVSIPTPDQAQGGQEQGDDSLAATSRALAPDPLSPQGGEQQESDPPLAEQLRSLALDPQIDQQPEKLSELAGGPTEHGEATVALGVSIPTPDQAQGGEQQGADSLAATSRALAPDPLSPQGGEQQESDPPLVKELRSLASDPQIDQQPDKLAELGNVLLKLAASKQEEAGDSAQDLSPYTEAAILYQHVLSICAQEDAQKKKILDSEKAKELSDRAYQGLDQIQASMLAQAKGVAPRATTSGTTKALRDGIAEDKRSLLDMRAKFKQRADELAEFRDKQGSDEGEYIGRTQELFKDIAEASKKLLANFYQEAEKELKAVEIERPCQYAIMGLGSVALQQTTPYSDLEFAILMEDAPDEVTAEAWRAYFRKLTYLVHFRVINLGETVLPFSEYEISLDHLGKRGLNFDLGGKTPLGRKVKKDKDKKDKDKPYELIQPVQQMAAYMQNEGGKMEQRDKLLPYILESTCHIYGDRSLHEAYEAKQANFLQEQAASGQYAYQQRIAKKLLRGVKDLGRQQPGDISSHRPSLEPIDAGKLYNVKEEIYRLADRLLYGLAMYYGLRPQSGWDAVEQLKESGKIHAEAACHLKYMVSFAAMLRLETYLHHGQQNEQLSLPGSQALSESGAEPSQAAHELLMLPPAALKEDGSLFKYYYTALPLHQQMEEFFELLHLRQQMRGKPVLERVLEEVFGAKGKYAAPQEGAYFQTEPFYDISCAVKVSVYNRLQQYEAAKDCAAKHHEEVKQRYFFNHAKLARYHHNLAVAYCHLGSIDGSFEHFDTARGLLEGVYGDGHPEIAKVLRSQGIAHYTQEHFEQSRQCFAKSLQQLQAFYNDNHPETAQMLLSLGAAYEALGNFEKSLKYKQQALEMLQALYPEKDPEIARALLSLGESYALDGKLEKSLEHKQEALEMFKDLCGKSHVEVARTLLSLGESYALGGKLAASLEHKEKALGMLQGLYGRTHPEVARALLSVGESYEAMGHLAKSKDYKNKSVTMLNVFYKGSHFEVIQARESLSRTKSARISALEGGNPVKASVPSLPRVRTVYPQQLTLLPTPRHGKEPAGENTKLREYYRQESFVYVKSLFEEQDSKHVKDLECQLMLLEQKLVKHDKEKAGAGDREDHIAQHHERRFEWVKTPLGSEDLFKKRSIRPGEPEKEIQRILLTGDPGTGKTTLSKQLAYQWSQGLWGQEFHTLYLLPVRSVQQSEYAGTRYNKEKTLSTAIVNTCFSHDLPATEAEYTSLRAHIDQELDKSTTLVILDGLDERAGACKEILSQAQAGTHKLLMLSRPYSIDAERRLAEIEIEHVGFNRGQLEAYIQAEVSDGDRASELLDYIDKHANIREITHVPVNIQILCALWQDEDYGVKKEELEQGSLPGLYRLFMEFTWQRYTKRCGIESENEAELFDTLGKIGLEALSQGKAQINPGLVHQYAKQETAKAKLKDAGFLLLQYVGEDAGRQSGFYEFPHLTFQEYFAGRRLAKQFLSEEAEASKFISKHKYESQYGRTLTFMAGEVSRVKGASGIEKLLGLLEQEKEVVGVQHLLLQLRVVHEWLCMAGEDAEDELAEVEDEFHVLSSLEAWFVRALAHVRLEGYDAGRPGRDLLGLLKSSLQTFGSISRHAPGLLKLFKEAAEGPHGSVRLAAVSSLGGALAGVDDDARGILQKMADDRHESGEIKEPAGAALSQATGGESGQDETAVGGGTAQGSSGGAMESSSQSPEALLGQLYQAAKDADDEDDDALRSSRGFLVQAVAFATEKELGALLAQLLPAAKDCNGWVRAGVQEVLLKAPLKKLLAQYWSRPDASLIPYITPRLYHTPLVIGKRARKGAQQVLLYAAAGQASKCEQPQGVVADFDRHVQDAVSQLSDVESKLSVRLDKSVWEQYFGSVGEEPSLPDGLEAIMDSDCPFWSGSKVRDTHLLALIPSQVAGRPLTLDYLGELITRPQAGHGTKYRYYWEEARKAIGDQSPDSSYWVLMTRDVLSGSRNKSYENQCALVAAHADRMDLAYEIPGALEAAVVMLLHHVRSGERLYSYAPATYTCCRESVSNRQLVVGGFSSGGLGVFSSYVSDYFGVAGLRKF